MKDLAELLESLVADAFQIKTKNNTISITENKPEASCKFVHLETDGPAFSFTLDKDMHIVLPFKREAQFINKVNDCILFFKKDDNLICLLIELKSSKDANYIHQLKSGRNFVRYLLNQINDFYDVKPQVKYFGLLFREAKSSPNKNPFRRGDNAFIQNVGLKVATLPGNQTYKLSYIRHHIPATD